jgi:hypothetical protein
MQVLAPVNLLVGIVIPGIMTRHSKISKRSSISLILNLLSAFVTFGLMYGVILPMLPSIRGPFCWRGADALLWTGVCYGMMGVVNPLMEQHVSWPWFIVSQLVYGLTMSYVVSRSERLPWRGRAIEMMKKRRNAGPARTAIRLRFAGKPALRTNSWLPRYSISQRCTPKTVLVAMGDGKNGAGLR